MIDIKLDAALLRDEAPKAEPSQSPVPAPAPEPFDIVLDAATLLRRPT